MLIENGVLLGVKPEDVVEGVLNLPVEVKMIGMGCLRNRTDIQQLIAPGLLKIAIQALENCTNLQVIEAPMLNEICSYGLSNTGIINLNLPSLKILHPLAIINCNNLKEFHASQLQSIVDLSIQVNRNLSIIDCPLISLNYIQCNFIDCPIKSIICNEGIITNICHDVTYGFIVNCIINNTEDMGNYIIHECVSIGNKEKRYLGIGKASGWGAASNSTKEEVIKRFN